MHSIALKSMFGRSSGLKEPSSIQCRRWQVSGRAVCCRRSTAGQKTRSRHTSGRVRSHGEVAATRVSTLPSASDSEACDPQDTAVPLMMGAPPSMDFPPLMGPFGAEPSQEYINEQLAHMIIPQLDDEFEQVAQALPLIKAELGDQQALLTACNQFLEDMAERHLNLLLQQRQSEARLAATRPNTPSTAAAAATGNELSDLQAMTELQLQLREASAHLEELELEQAQELHEVTMQLEQQKQQAQELQQQKELLRSQLRVVTMEREELKQQLMDQDEADTASAAAAQLQDTLQQLSDAQEKLVAAEQKVEDALDSNQQLTEQLAKAQTAAEVAKASVLAATSSASAATHAQLQEASAKVATLEAQLAASEEQLAVTEQRSAAVAGSNELLQQQLAEAHAQGGRLIGMNRQLMKHAEQLEAKYHQQAALVEELQEDKAASAAELAGIYMMLQEMQGVQQRQQLLQQQLLQIITQQHKQAQPGQAPNSTASSDGGATAAAAAVAAAAQGPAAEQEAEEGANSLVKALSGAVFGAALPLVGIFIK